MQINKENYKFYLFVIIFLIVFIGIRWFMKMEEKVMENIVYENSYPIMFSEEKGDDKYHSTNQIFDQLLYDNNLNPFYCSYTLETYYSSTEQMEKYNNFFKTETNDDVYRTLGYGPCKENNNNNNNNSNLRVALICGQHGRELISSELCYHLIRLLQTHERHPLITERISKLREKGVSFWILPIVNEWGRRKIEGDPESSCLRKNIFGVDLNRNFECPDFIRGVSKNKDSSEYAGSENFSEVETRITDSFLNMVQPNLLFNIHSGIERILLPYDCCETQLPKKYTLMSRIARLSKLEVIKKHKELKYVSPKRWQIGKSSLLLYTSHGTLMDYAEVKIGIPLVYTLEIYESLDADNSISDDELTATQCMEWFNPKAGEEYKEVILIWLDQIITMVEKTFQRIKVR